jgi:hypothetical protein
LAVCASSESYVCTKNNPSMKKFANTQPQKNIQDSTSTHGWIHSIMGTKPPHSEPSNFVLKDMGCLAIYS